jgi:hypothetical protein
MAIAALPEDEVLELPWPKPSLRLIEGGLSDLIPDNVPLSWDDGSSQALWPSPQPLIEPLRAPYALGRDVASRRRARLRIQARRRRFLGGALLLALLVALAAPVSALAGPSASPARARAGLAVPSRAETKVFVVQPGETLASLATRMNGGTASPSLVAALSSELGNASLTPGERVLVP